MCLCMASRHAKYGRRLRPATGGPPNGTNDVARVMTLAGWSEPDLTSFRSVHSARRSTLALGPVCVCVLHAFVCACVRTCVCARVCACAVGVIAVAASIVCVLTAGAVGVIVVAA